MREQNAALERRQNVLNNEMTRSLQPQNELYTADPDVAAAAAFTSDYRSFVRTLTNNHHISIV